LFLKDFRKGLEQWLSERGQDALESVLARWSSLPVLARWFSFPGAVLLFGSVSLPLRRLLIIGLSLSRHPLYVRLVIRGFVLERLVEFPPDGRRHLLPKLRHGWLERLPNLLLEHLA